METEEAVFQRAFCAYKNGRYQDAMDLLEGVNAAAFERDRWAVLNCNILVCKMEKLKSTVQLAEVLEGYRDMWQRIKGLPPCRKNLPVELATCCNACQTIYCLWQGGDTHFIKEGLNLSEEAITRASQCCNVDTVNVANVLVQLAAKLSHTDGKDGDNSVSSLALQCLMRLALLHTMFLSTEGRDDEASTILQSITTILGCPGDQEAVEMDPTSTMLRASLLVEKFMCMNRCEAGLHYEPLEGYLEAWQAYQSSRYQESLRTLQGVCDCAHTPLLAMGSLLAGCCYMRQGKLQLALCSFQRCLRSPACLLPALHNCVQVFRLLGNEEAEFGFRRLLMGALEKGWEPEGRERKDWRACPQQSLSLHLLHVQYDSAMRALQCKRYRTASRLIKCVIDVMKQGKEPLLHHLHSPTQLHLLLAHSLLSCGEYTECQVVASRLASAMSPSISSVDVSVITGEVVLQGLPAPFAVSVVTLLQSVFVRGCALQCERNLVDAQQCYQRILKITNATLPLLLSSPDREQFRVALRQIEDLKVSTLNNLAVIAVARAEHSQSFALIVQALACPRGVSETTVANYVQLLLKQGKKADAYTSWLQYRGKLPASVRGGTEMLKDAQSVSMPSDEGQLDIEALNFWVLQKRVEK
ncbi:hypothetical protein EMCRGX_G034448 [Ephydatia muelleri]